ncbi:glycoside hydrolase family 88 protein [Vibrio agarivorans]|uniref:glycoside hydrolase family 88 protein n=1 Tax=Vibrio agarivorans TaxID=153622 RepID=UPI0025B59537|nr:glycoside hydrolase family 88 protein [Vibrio agarivorans]MDN3660273.1 glycoside hydrolase family 88 protein [Vibrio agarivorans]
MVTCEIETPNNKVAENNNIVDDAIKRVLKKVDLMMTVYHDGFPASASENLVYPKIENTQWTTCFWTGLLWLAYENTNDEKYRLLGESLMDKFEERLDKKICLETHDMGFLFTLSCLAPYKINGNEKAKELAVRAAEVLINRYHDKAQVIQAWGNVNDPNHKVRMIIDCNMNLPLLYWATDITGDQKYRNIALSHLARSNSHIIRDDYSTHHTYFFDKNDGTAIGGKTFQGYSDESTWARGQAWGVYGLALSYKHTGDYSLIEMSKKLADYFLDHLPEDLVAYWDLTFTSGDEPRDSSATAIFLCGLQELLKHLPVGDADRARYEAFVDKAIENLSDSYISENDDEYGVLLHGTYAKPDGRGIDEFCIWGDYFFLEALIRKNRDWNTYW